MRIFTPISYVFQKAFLRLKALNFAALRALVVVVLAGFSFQARAQNATLDLVVGWNLIGNSSSGTLNVATALGDAAKVDTVWKWVSAKGRWAFYSPALAGQALSDYAAAQNYDVLTSVNAGDGFWVKAKTAFAVQLPAGSAVPSTAFRGLAPGWNLIAVGDSKTPSQFNTALSAIPQSSGITASNLTSLWAWDASHQKWYFYAPSLDSNGTLTDYVASNGYVEFGSKSIGPTMGVWVNVPKFTTLSAANFDIPSGQTASIFNSVSIDADTVNIAGNLLVQNNLGQSVTIHSKGDVVVAGAILASNGGMANAGTAASPVAAASTADGGSISITSDNGNISIQGVIKAGDGLASPSATTTAGSLIPTIANGGAGAHGGSVILRARKGSINVAQQDDLIHVGNGGNGADIEVAGLDLASYTITSPTNGGGHSGALVLDATTISGLTTSAVAAKSDFPPQAPLFTKGSTVTVATSKQVSGGVGGRAGALRFGVDKAGNSTWPAKATSTGNVAVAREAAPYSQSQTGTYSQASSNPSPLMFGSAGGTGFYVGGNGADASIRGYNGAQPGENGQSVAAYGGYGGTGIWGDDGNGGNATAVGGDGAFGTSTPPGYGGWGGDATAAGGGGANAGGATAYGGYGGVGGSNCAAQSGGEGGRGGEAHAKVVIANKPNPTNGALQAQGGNGGNGGKGNKIGGLGGHGGYGYIDDVGGYRTKGVDGSEGSQGSTITCPVVLKSITFTGPSSVVLGKSVTFTAFGYYSDGSQADVTNQVIWSVDSPNIAASPASSPNTFIGNNVGTTAITITWIGIGNGASTLTFSGNLSVVAPTTTSSTSLYLGGAQEGSVYQGLDGLIKTVGRGLEGQNGPNGPKLDVSTSLSTVPIGPPKSGNAVKPVRLAAATPAFVDAVSAGSYHTAAIRSGQVYTWGSNYYGNLCDGTTTDNATPTAVTGMSSALAVAAGNAKTLALLSDGTVWACGGYAGTPALGNGTTNASTVAVQVSGLSNVVGIATAAYWGFHSLAILNDGTVWAWGPNASGQIGDGTKVNRNVPVKVSGLTGVKTVAASMNGSLALTSDGTVWSWGQIAGGANIASAPVTNATPSQVAGLTNVVAIAAGDYHYLALKSDGTVWAWGLDLTTGNRNGQLGNGKTVNNNTPTQVAALAGVTHIGAGGYHSLARKSDGSVWAWGWNAHGQLGDGTTTDRYTPVQVPGLLLN